MKFRKKPIIIEAIQHIPSGELTKELIAFLGGETQRESTWSYSPSNHKLRIVTREGVMTALPGDWIIKGVKGEFYPCKNDIFTQTYELVTPEAKKPVATPNMVTPSA